MGTAGVTVNEYGIWNASNHHGVGMRKVTKDMNSPFQGG